MPIITEDSPITFNDALPEAVDVVIIGGGIAGVMAAWFLSKAGKSVFICEKGRVAGEQSSRNWGFVRQAGRDASELPMMIDGMSIWQELQDQMGDAIGFRRPGSLFCTSYSDLHASYEAWVYNIGKPHGLPCRMISTREIDKHLNGQPHRFSGGLYTERDGCAEPFTAVPAIAKYLNQNERVLIREHCAVRLLCIEGGEVTGVHTEDGDVRAEQVLVAGGAWTGKLLHNHGIVFPQLLVNTTLARTAPAKDPINLNFGFTKACFRSRVDGGYTVTPGEIMEHHLCLDTLRFGYKFLPALKFFYRNSRLRSGLGPGFLNRMAPKQRWKRDEVTPFELNRIANPRLSGRHFKLLKRRLRAHFPDLAQLDILEAWTGSADMTPDILPAIGPIHSLPRLYIASGLSGHGFGLGPAVGKAIANNMLGRSDQFDLTPFRFERFYEGKKLRAGILE